MRAVKVVELVFVCLLSWTAPHANTLHSRIVATWSSGGFLGFYEPSLAASYLRPEHRSRPNDHERRCPVMLTKQIVEIFNITSTVLHADRSRSTGYA